MSITLVFILFAIGKSKQEIKFETSGRGSENPYFGGFRANIGLQRSICWSKCSGIRSPIGLSTMAKTMALAVLLADECYPILDVAS